MGKTFVKKLLISLDTNLIKLSFCSSSSNTPSVSGDFYRFCGWGKWLFLCRFWTSLLLWSRSTTTSPVNCASCLCPKSSTFCLYSAPATTSINNYARNGDHGLDHVKHAFFGQKINQQHDHEEERGTVLDCGVVVVDDPRDFAEDVDQFPVAQEGVLDDFGEFLVFAEGVQLVGKVDFIGELDIPERLDFHFLELVQLDT